MHDKITIIVQQRPKGNLPVKSESILCIARPTNRPELGDSPDRDDRSRMPSNPTQGRATDGAID